MKVKEETEKAGLKLNIQKTKITTTSLIGLEHSLGRELRERSDKRINRRPEDHKKS